MFGINKKSNLVRDLLKKRLEMRDEISPDNLNFINSLGALKLSSLPEATIVAVLDTVVKAERQGLAAYDALSRLEKVRGVFRTDRHRFQTIHQLSRENPYGTTIEYISYRIEIESNSYAFGFSDGLLSRYEITQLVSVARPIIQRW